MHLLNDRTTLIHKILNLLPDEKYRFIHTTGNSLDVILLGRCYKFTVFNDINKILFRLFEAIKDNINAEQFIDDISDAYLETVKVLSMFKPHINKILCKAKVRIPNIVRQYISAVPFLEEIYSRFCTVQVDYLDFDRCISYYDDKHSFFYAEFFEESKFEISRRLDTLNRCSGSYIVVIPADKADYFDMRGEVYSTANFVLVSRLPQEACLFSVC